MNHQNLRAHSPRWKRGLHCWTLGLVVAACPVFAAAPAAIQLRDLPAPPAAIAGLIRDSQVTFEAGPRNGNDDSSRPPRIVAETHFQIAYRYKSRSRWNVDARKGLLRVQTRFSQVLLTPTHRIWFHKRPSTTGFWSDRLVLHELDHVKVSSDPRLIAKFVDILKEQASFTHPLSPGEIANQTLVDRLVEQRVRRAFQQIEDLVAVRYQELDRVTGHGLKPVPQAWPLYELLNPGNANSP